jgi:hypothetical protein
MQECLWDYIPKQRKIVEIPAVDARAWVDEAKLQLQNFAVTHFIGGLGRGGHAEWGGARRRPPDGST